MRTAFGTTALGALLVLCCACGTSAPGPANAAYGHALTRMLAHRCPTRALPGASGAHLPWGNNAPLVPSDSRSDLVMCHYAGMSPATGTPTGTAPPHAPRAEIVRDTGTVHTLADQLNALPGSRRGTFNCPADRGNSVLAAFTDGHGRGVLLRATLSGCPTVTDGHTVRWLSGPPLTCLGAEHR